MHLDEAIFNSEFNERATKDRQKPNHYPQNYDVIDFVKDNDLNFNEGNVIKYVVRCRKKGTHLQDLQKAKDYLEREIYYLTKKELQK
jgi:hypothetical protein